MTFKPGIINLSFDDEDEDFTITLKHSTKLKKLPRHEVHAMIVLLVCECYGESFSTEVIMGIKHLKIDSRHPTTT